MKTVFKSNEIAHIWAHSGAPYGRSPGNLSFDGDAIKSYGTVIGRRIRHKGKSAYVLDRASFSVSTSKSQGRVWQAIPEPEMVFSVRCGRRGQSLDFTPAELAAHYESEAKSAANELPSRYAFKRADQWRTVTAHLKNARAVLAFFELGTFRLDRAIEKRMAGEATAAETLAAYRTKLETQRKALEAMELAKRIDRTIRQAEDYIAGKLPRQWIDLASKSAGLALLSGELRACFVAAVEKGNAAFLADWCNGKPGELPCDCPTMLRAECKTGYPDDAEMVTSHGARVPLTDARRTYRFAMKCRAKGWHRNGETHAIGGYQLDAVNEQGVVAGCHRVTWAEIERFAAACGWNQ